MSTDTPLLLIDHLRNCKHEEDVNCFHSMQGCSSKVDNIVCDDSSGWSVSVTFVGTGVEIYGLNSRCTERDCEWTIDGNEQQWPTDDSARRPVIYAPDMEGGDDTKHTVVISSRPPTDGVQLGIQQAIVHTGLETPVHKDDTIWINPRNSMLEFQGNWEELDETTPSASRRRELVDGVGKVNMEIQAASFQYHYWPRLDLKNQLDSNYPNWTVSVDGNSGSQSEVEEIDLDRDSVHSISLTATHPTSENATVEFWGLSYRPHSQSAVTRIRDATPGAGDREGGALGAREPIGAILLMPAVLICYLLRLKL